MATLIENVYSKLKLMLLKREEQRNASLLAHLKKINDHLATRASRFLTGDTICCFDCELMPRLQHIRVAGKYFADFEIPVGCSDRCRVCNTDCFSSTFADVFDGTVALHVPHVPAGRVHAIVPGRSGHHQSL